MSPKKLFLIGALGSLPLLFACGDAAGDQSALNGNDDTNGAPGSPNAGYFRVRADDRGCDAPDCGGFFVSRVNRGDTQCSDGVVRAECYVQELDTKQLGLDQNGDSMLRTHLPAFLLHGQINPGSTQMGALAIDEAWRGHDGVVAQGDYLRVRDTGLTCITYPCPSYQAQLLNSPQPPQKATAVRLGNVGDDREKAQQQLSAPMGLLVAATWGDETGPAGTGPALDATEYFLPFSDAKVILGCGPRLPNCPEGQFCQYAAAAQCGAADVPGVCALPPEQCTQESNPVCGCDGQTYPNACQAAAANNSVAYVGECKPQSFSQRGA